MSVAILVTVFSTNPYLAADPRQSLREVQQRWTSRAATLQGEARRQYAAEQRVLLDEVEALLTGKQVERFRSARG